MAGELQKSYRGHNFYKLLTVLCVVLVVLFAWQLYQRWDWGALLFLAVSAWSAFRCYRLMSSRVELMADRVRLVAPWAATREVEFRQLSSVTEEGRGMKSILLLYHPRGEDGLFALDDERALLLPAVNQHEELLATLTAQLPT